MKPSTMLNLALIASTASAGVIKNAEQPTTNAISRRDNCHAGETKIYTNHNGFLCVGTKVLWTGVALVSLNAGVIGQATQQFATWVTNKVVGAPTDTESKRDFLSEATVWAEDDDVITYGWSPQGLTLRDSTDTSFIHNMTKIYSKATGFLTEAEMTFDAEHEDVDGVSKRANTPVTITYYAESGHETTSLNFNDVQNLYNQVFYASETNVGSECGYAANSGTWHGAFKATVSGCRDAGACNAERVY